MSFYENEKVESQKISEKNEKGIKLSITKFLDTIGDLKVRYN